MEILFILQKGLLMISILMLKKMGKFHLCYLPDLLCMAALQPFLSFQHLCKPLPKFLVAVNDNSICFPFVFITIFYINWLIAVQTRLSLRFFFRNVLIFLISPLIC